MSVVIRYKLKEMKAFVPAFVGSKRDDRCFLIASTIKTQNPINSLACGIQQISGLERDAIKSCGGAKRGAAFELERNWSD
jgi:hypothetical protein